MQPGDQQSGCQREHHGDADQETCLTVADKPSQPRLHQVVGGCGDHNTDYGCACCQTVIGHAGQGEGDGIDVGNTGGGREKIDAGITQPGSQILA